MKLSSELLEIITCPVSGGKLTYDEKRQVLISESVSLEYPIIDGIPMLLKSEARTVNLNKNISRKDEVTIE